MNQITTPFFAAVSAFSSMTRRVTQRTPKTSVVPKHVALVLGNLLPPECHKILDNERFSKEQQALLEVTEAALKQGVSCLSVSLSNFWSEHQAKYVLKFLNTQAPLLGQRGVRLTTQFAQSDPVETRMLQTALDTLSSSMPALGTEKLRLHLRVSVNSADEIAAAVQRLARKVQSGTVTPETFTRQDLERELNQSDVAESACLPEVDLLLHTADAKKLSRMFFWKTAYAEIFFSSGHWLDFTQQHFIEALSDYSERRRTFGGLK